MALTRKMLKAMGIEEEKIDQIIEAHTETTDALKNELNGYKEDADKLKEVQKELDTLKSAGEDDWKVKHDAVKKEFDDFKADLNAKETLAKKKTAFAKIAKSKGITDDKLIDLISSSYDFSKVTLDGDKFKEEDTIGTYLATEYSGFISKDGKDGANVTNPPANTGGAKTKEEILAIKDGHERRKAMAENPELFGIKE
jgi:hypothetical protein